MGEENLKNGEGNAVENERTKREQVLKGDLGIASRKVRERFVPPLHEMVLAATEGMPQEIKSRVMRRFEKIKEFSDKVGQAAISEEDLKELQEKYGVPVEKVSAMRERQTAIAGENVENFLKGQVDIIAAEVRSAFMAEMGKDDDGKEIMMPNKGFAKFEAQQSISDILEHDPSSEALKRVARISFDLNGLKAVNDLNASHEQGDVYLLLVKKVLEDPKVVAFATQKGLKYVATRDGGDEFGLIVTSDFTIEVDPLNELRKMIEDKLSSDQAAVSCLDFEDDKILLHYNRITGDKEKEFHAKLQEEREALLAQYRVEIPEGFQFRAYISSGACTLYDAMVDPLNDEDGDNRINEGDSSGRILKKMMSCLFNTSDARMQANKSQFKNDLAEGNDYDKMMSRIYARTAKEEELQKKIDDLMGMVMGLKDLKEVDQKLKGLGTSEEERNKMLANKMRELFEKM